MSFVANVAEEAISALTTLGASLEELKNKIHSTTQTLKTTYESNSTGLGAHAADILSLLEDMESSEEEASKPVKKLVLKLNRAANIRRQHIDNNGYSQGQGGRSR